jgi:hypothetical protein
MLGNERVHFCAQLGTKTKRPGADAPGLWKDELCEGQGAPIVVGVVV